MGGYYIILLITCGSCSEWVQLPSIIPERSNVKKYQFSNGYGEDLSRKTSTNESADFCPDFHNLTAMTFGSVFKKDIQSRSSWEISLEDVEELLEENQKLPKTSGGKVNFVKQMGDALMTEAEQQIMALFLSPREARTKHFHFASMESALMTISMLLFGVYLSKLILKLLLSHYNRYRGGLAMMNGIRAHLTFPHGQRKRARQLQEIQLMHVIDKYNSQYN